MNARIAAIAIIAASTPALAQGFAGLGTDAEGFRIVAPGRAFSFPEDHGPHPGFRIEWWYVTANLQDTEGNPYGLQWTLFRQALEPSATEEGWQSTVLWMGHAGLTSETDHYSAEKFARGGIGQAGVTAAPFEAYIDDWSIVGMNGGDPLSAVNVSAAAEDFAYDIDLTTNRAPVLQGNAGFSVKSEAGQASYYYSQPFFEASGTITIEGEDIAVTGLAWMDREWSSQPLSEDQEGWDWFSLHLPGGEKLMLYRLRAQGGSTFVPGTWIAANGTPTPLDPGAITMTPLETSEVAGRQIPTRWRLEIPSRGFDVKTEPVNPQSWMATTFSYWEGPIRFSGTHDGVGYLEMTGYGGEE